MKTWQTELMAEMLEIYAGIEAMKAENMNRAAKGEQMAYTENSFMDAACRARQVRDQIIQLTGG